MSLKLTGVTVVAVYDPTEMDERHWTNSGLRWMQRQLMSVISSLSGGITTTGTVHMKPSAV